MYAKRPNNSTRSQSLRVMLDAIENQIRYKGLRRHLSKFADLIESVSQ